MKTSVQAIILAAGKSTRCSTAQTKLAELICGQPMILFSTRLLESLSIETTVVVGHEKELIQHIISSHHGDTVTYAEQKQQLGTGHALACSQHVWNKENILIINGDMPLITQDVIVNLYTKHQETNATVSFVTSCSADKEMSKAYGRVIMRNNKVEIVEAKDFVGNPADACCINAGIYLIKKDFLCNYITTLRNNNASNEFYITDLIKIASENDEPVTKIPASFDTIRGVNTLEELIIAEHIKKSDIIKQWMRNGVRFASLHNTRVDSNVTIKPETYIGEGVHLLGSTTIGKGSTVERYSSLENTHLEDDVRIAPFSIITDSIIPAHAKIGPFVHMHNNVSRKADSLFNHETKNSFLNEQKRTTKVSYSENSIESSDAFSFTAARLIHDITPDEQ